MEPTEVMVIPQANLFFLGRKVSKNSSPTPPVALPMASFLKLLYHTQRRITVCWTHPLNECLARRRDLYLSTHNTHNGQTSMPPMGFEPHNLSRRAAVELRLRTRGHWNRQAKTVAITISNFQFKRAFCPLRSVHLIIINKICMPHYFLSLIARLTTDRQEISLSPEETCLHSMPHCTVFQTTAVCFCVQR